MACSEVVGFWGPAEHCLARHNVTIKHKKIPRALTWICATTWYCIKCINSNTFRGSLSLFWKSPGKLLMASSVGQNINKGLFTWISSVFRNPANCRWSKQKIHLAFHDVPSHVPLRFGIFPIILFGARQKFPWPFAPRITHENKGRAWVRSREEVIVSASRVFS